MITWRPVRDVTIGHAPRRCSLTGHDHVTRHCFVNSDGTRVSIIKLLSAASCNQSNATLWLLYEGDIDKAIPNILYVTVIVVARWNETQVTGGRHQTNVYSKFIKTEKNRTGADENKTINIQNNPIYWLTAIYIVSIYQHVLVNILTKRGILLQFKMVFGQNLPRSNSS